MAVSRAASARAISVSICSCSFPTDARDFDAIWDELKQRFAGFDYAPLIHGGTDDARHLCWERRLTSDRT